MSVVNNIKTAETNLSTFFSDLTTYLSGTTGSSEPDLLSLSQSLEVLDIITEASNRLNGYSGASSGVLSEVVDRLNSVKKESEIFTQNLAAIYLQGAGEAQASREYWSQYLVKALNTFGGRTQI